MEIYEIKLKTGLLGNWHEMLLFISEIIKPLDIPPFDGNW